MANCANNLCSKGSTIKKTCDTRELNKLREDYCYLDRRNYDTKKPLKMITYQYRPYQVLTKEGGIKIPCDEGYYYVDGYIGPFTVDADSKLKLEGLTHGKEPIQLDGLRPNSGRSRGCQCVDEESELTVGATFQTKAKACSETELYIPRWEYLNHLGYFPNRTEIDHGHYGGISTFNTMRENYLSGNKTCYKNINVWKL